MTGVNVTTEQLVTILTTAGVIATAVISWLSSRRTSVENIARAATALVDPLRERVAELEASQEKLERINRDYGRRISELEEQNRREIALRKHSERLARQLTKQMELMEEQRDLMQSSIDVLRSQIAALETQLRALGLVPVTQQKTTTKRGSQKP